MAKSGITVTGLEEFEGNLTMFTRTVAPAEIRKGTRDAANLVLQEYKVRCEQHSNIVENTIEGGRGDANTGAMRDAAVVRAVKRSRIRIGHAVKILRDRLFALYAARKGHPPNPRRGEREPFFYPAMVELGDKDHQAERPLRGSLYDNETAVKTEFSKSLLRAVNSPKIKHKKK